MIIKSLMVSLRNSISNHLSDGPNYRKSMAQLLDMCYTNKNGKISCYKEVAWYTRSVLSLLNGVILQMKDWAKVNSSYYLRTIDLGAVFKPDSAYIVKDAFSSSL